MVDKMTDTVFDVAVILEGYSFEDKDGNYRATGSVTLVKGQINVLVDTGSPWDTDIVIAGLEKEGVTPQDVNFVVGTHGHSDHIGNLNLFKNATHIVGFDISHKDIYLDNSLKQGENYVIIKNQLEVMPTPGHTHSDVSLIVRHAAKYGTVVVAGDLFECENDEDTWQSISEAVDVQTKNRQKVLSFADYIIPGHGPLFKVKAN